MILKESILFVIDSSGVRLTKTFSLYGGFSRKKTSIGFFTKGSVRLIKKKPKNPHTKKKFFKKGNIVKSILLRQVYAIKRRDSSSIYFKDNASALIKKKNVLHSNFLLGCSVSEVRNKKFLMLFKSQV